MASILPQDAQAPWGAGEALSSLPFVSGMLKGSAPSFLLHPAPQDNQQVALASKLANIFLLRDVPQILMGLRHF